MISAYPVIIFLVLLVVFGIPIAYLVGFDIGWARAQLPRDQASGRPIKIDQGGFFTKVRSLGKGRSFYPEEGDDFGE